MTKSFLRRAWSRESSFMPFVKGITAGYVLFCVPKENQKPATFEAREARIKGYSPLIIPKEMGSIQKIQVAPLEDFLCSADFESLMRRTVRVSLCAICCATAAG